MMGLVAIRKGCQNPPGADPCVAGSEALVADLDDDFAAGVAVGDHPDQYGAVGDLGGGQFGQLRPRISRGMRRSQDRAAPQSLTPLGPRHGAALEQLREGPLTVGALAARLDLTLSTVSGVLADLDRAGFIGMPPAEGHRVRTTAASTTRN